MRYKPYPEAANEPNIIVDGAATQNTVLTLSHWPRSGTPPALLADTSTEIVFKYLDAPAYHVPAEAASNNHFDEDGLLGIFALIDPAFAQDHRELMLDAAAAGDFSVYKTREAARIAMTIKAYGQADESPYEHLLGLLPELLTNVNKYRSVWQRDDERLARTEDLVARGLITFEDQADLDLAVIRGSDDPSVTQRLSDWHDYALHNQTPRTRLVLMHGREIEFRYRYEGWVQFQSRQVLPRVDLQPLAQELTQIEESGGHWVFEGVGSITPSLHFEGEARSSIEPEAIIPRLEHHLRTGAPAWNPYG